jgi:hypothetical protein
MGEKAYNFELGTRNRDGGGVPTNTKGGARITVAAFCVQF